MGSVAGKACDCTNVLGFGSLKHHDDSMFPIGHGLSRNSQLIHKAVNKNRKSEPARLNPSISQLVNSETQNQQTLDKEKWVKAANCLDTNRLLMVYPSYTIEQSEYKKNWTEKLIKRAAYTEARKDDDVMSPELKYMIRKGVPLSSARKLFKRIFGLKVQELSEMTYQVTLETVFKGKIPVGFRKCPTFSNAESILEAVPSHLLTEDGMKAMERILWLIDKTRTGLDYCPLLPVVTSFLLVVFKEWEAFYILTAMLDNSSRLLDSTNQVGAQGLRGLRWYFPMNEDDLRKVCVTFVDHVKRNSPRFTKIVQFLEHKNFNTSELFFTWFSTMFQGYINYDFLFRVFFCYLNEGIKIFYRMGYAILRNLRRSFLEQRQLRVITDSNRIRTGLVVLCHNLTRADEEKMIKRGFTLRIARLQSKFDEVEVKKEKPSFKIQKIYKPFLKESSKIIPDETFEIIFDWIPSQFRIIDPVLAYASWRDGFGLKNALALMSNEKEKSILVIILIQNDKSEVFGAFLDCPFQVTDKFTGTDVSSVFQLKPKEAVYHGTENNNHVLMVTVSDVTIGDGDFGPAIWLDTDFNQGRSNACDTFASPALIQSRDSDKKRTTFKAINVEVFILQ